MPRLLTASYRESAVSAAGQIHRLIRDGEMEEVIELVNDNASLLIQPNSIGWTSLHFSASHEISVEHWKYLLERIPEKTQLLSLKTDMGLTFIDHFFLRYLNPLPWQRPEVHEAAETLRERISSALKSKEAIGHIRRSIDSKTPHDMHDDPLLEFWDRIQSMLKSVWGPRPFRLLHALATTGCPEEVAELALKLFPEQQSHRDEQSLLPLHYACLHPSSKYPLETLLSNHVDEPDADGSLPLHLALTSSRTWRTGISSLWSAYPLYDSKCHTKTNFPPFLLATMPDPVQSRRKVQQRAAQNFQGMWRFLSTASQLRAMADARRQIELEHLDTIYELLRAEPSAIVCSSFE
mmetsp:Transcript_23592/g.33803  ORF Transcript_23592/g.33803 Transcript_23592/m.33803 type:complete len:350 (+) Transcript_23592:203-1252(+)|eukprot:CAMPEP_0202454994 /NCGR_PEP_ID=MMETSP1360-20130828/12625_1 /ASSEMBLY_ACC=CAM_ASM_000848 /TAXON_ID=515479 /ORGANISM="Licmophora paradoxa, Strain CCMP2313" /LENGTH=349 /DNA_ID=CAMNT_0049074465 /DNA_START=110 /DNA_END=1159 /DNA_ORIENTATION=+